MLATNAPMFRGNQLAAAVYLGTKRLWARPETLSLDFAADQYKMGGIAELPTTRQFSDLITFTRASGGGRFNASGQYEWLAADQPRIDYDPVTGEAKGLLIEEQRTNLLTYSSDFSNAVWTKRGKFTVTPNAAKSPDGTASASLVTGLNSGTNDIYHQGINSGGLAAEARYEPSVYVKKVTQTGTVNISNSYTPSYGDWTVDLSKVGDGWERITRSHPAVTVVAEFKVHTTGYLGIQLRKTTAGEVSLYIWGAQLESGSFPTSYIPTTTAQVTRAADAASVNVLSPWFNASEGTLFVEFMPIGFTPAAVNGIASFSDGTTTDNRFQLRSWGTNQSASMTVFTGGVQRANTFEKGGVYSPLIRQKVAASWGPDKYSMVCNGEFIGEAANGHALYPTQLQIGRGLGGTEMQGHYKAIRFYPKYLPVSQREALTA